MELTHEQIAELIPHRYPFLFIDGVTNYEKGKFIDGFKQVSFDEPFFQGHFPGKPIMPGVIITEALAQLACVLLSLELGDKAKEATPLFLGIDKAKFRSMVVPGARLDMRIEVESLRRGIAKVKGVAKVGDDIAAEADIKCMLKAKG